MDGGLSGLCLPSVFIILSTLFFEDAICQVYSWSVSVPLNISVCSNSLNNPLTLDWIYTPSTPSPAFIDWSKLGSGSSVTPIATYNGVTFTPGASFTGRVTRAGNTAEIAIQGPLTAADGGVYQVSVTNSTGHNLPGFANVIFPVVNEPINGSCVDTAPDTYTVTCSVDVSPPVTLQLKKGSDFVGSASSDSGLSQTVSSAGTYQCSVTGQGSECVTPNSKEVNCASAPEPDEGGFPLIAVIILAILLVGIIVTGVLFVLYRWGGFFTGISVQKVYILYWSCFVQGIVDCVFGVIFFIVTCAVYTERLDEPLATGTLVLSLIVIFIGAVNILLCCRCYKSPGEVDGKPGSSGPSSNAGGPRPWLCCCCPKSKICSGEESRQSPPAPIPAAMASPRKPVPPNSTSARPLPSPTSDPASDSAVNPKVLLEPLNVEEPKKKKKRRKKRKSTKEAGEESAAQTMTAAGDSDDD